MENISNFARRFGIGQKPVFQRRRGSGTRFLHTAEEPRSANLRKVGDGGLRNGCDHPGINGSDMPVFELPKTWWRLTMFFSKFD